MISIGPHELVNPWILAPMAGVSEMPFRLLALELGAGLAPTELVSSAGLVRASARTRKYLRHGPEERPFTVQLFGGDPVQMAEAGLMARAAGAEVLDINMGCPVPKVTRNGAGSALLCHPERAAALVSALVRATGLPVTAKIRAGWDSMHINAPEVARELEGAGASAIALHPRTRAQGYSGAADWRVIAAVKQAVRIPVIGNGDVRSPQDARRMQDETGCDAVMVGRAALGNPWIFRELGGGPPATAAERCRLVARHFHAHLDFVGDALHGVRQFRKHLLWYARGLHGAASFRTRAVSLEEPSDVAEAIEEFFGSSLPAGEGSIEAEGEAEVDLRGALG